MPTSSTRCIFLVGCPRSGTTLLQSLLTAHPQIVSFPESHFFLKLTANRSLWRRKLGSISPQLKPHLQSFFHELKHEEMQEYMPKFNLSLESHIGAFVKVLDILTAQEGRALWLEKTPRHLQHIECIERFLPDAKFIHIIRNGSDVVASLYEVTQKYPELWQGSRDIDTCISRWIGDVEISFNYLDSENHMLVRYEDLVEYTSPLLKQLCEFIGIDFVDVMLEKYGRAAKQISLSSEVWKDSVSDQIQNRNSEKFLKLFDSDQRRYITGKTAAVNSQVLETLSFFPNLVSEEKVS